MSADACTRSICADFFWKSHSGDLIHSFTSENVDLTLWKFSKGTSCPKVSKQDRCLWCLLQIQLYSSSEGFFLQLYRFPEECLAHQQGKEQQGWNITLGHLVDLPEVSLVRFKQPLKKLLVEVKRHKETQWVFLLCSSQGNTSIICIFLGKGEQSLRVGFLPEVIKLFYAVTLKHLSNLSEAMLLYFTGPWPEWLCLAGLRHEWTAAQDGMKRDIPITLLRASCNPVVLFQALSFFLGLPASHSDVVGRWGWALLGSESQLGVSFALHLSCCTISFL